MLKSSRRVLLQKVKQSIVNTSKKVAREVGVHLNMEFESDALDLIAEMMWKKLGLFGFDLEAFEKHAKRSTITVDDVKLLVRRNDSLVALVDNKIQIAAASKPPTSDESSSNSSKRKRKNPSTS